MKLKSKPILDVPRTEVKLNQGYVKLNFYVNRMTIYAYLHYTFTYMYMCFVSLLHAIYVLNKFKVIL